MFVCVCVLVPDPETSSRIYRVHNYCDAENNDFPFTKHYSLAKIGGITS